MYVVRVGLVPENRQYKRQWDTCIIRDIEVHFQFLLKSHYII